MFFIFWFGLLSQVFGRVVWVFFHLDSADLFIRKSLATQLSLDHHECWQTPTQRVCSYSTALQSVAPSQHDHLASALHQLPRPPST